MGSATDLESLLMRPLVSVAVPTRDRPAQLNRCLRSIYAQHYGPIEALVSDNGRVGMADLPWSPTDRISIRYLRQTGMLSMSENWDVCLREARGQLFLLMSDDDAFSDPAALEHLVGAFDEARPDRPDFVFGQTLLRDRAVVLPASAGSTEDLHNPADALFRAIDGRLSIFPCSTIFRRADLLEAGGYAAQGLSLAIDASMWLALLARGGRGIALARPVAIYDIGDSMTSSPASIWIDDLHGLVEQVRDSSESEVLTSPTFLRAIDDFRGRAALVHAARSLQYRHRVDRQQLRALWAERATVLSRRNARIVASALRRRLVSRVSSAFAPTRRRPH